MQYLLRIYKEGRNQLYKIYNDQIQAERKIKKSFNDIKYKAKVIKIPNIKPGLILYKNNKQYFGTIVKETASMWLIANTELAIDDTNPFLKETFIDKFMNEQLEDGYEEYDELYVNNAYITVDKIEEDYKNYEEED